MLWKKYLNQISAELAEYLRKDIQYFRIPVSEIRRIAWREIELFVEEFKHWPPERLILKENASISKQDQKKLDNFLNQRLKSVPLAHIIGKQKFYNLDFKINKNTLIPRPETEELIEYVLQHIKDNATLIDVGTGSGCILTAILKNLPKNTTLSKIYAVEISKPAIAIAKENIKKHFGAKYKVNFVNSPLLSRNIAYHVPTRWVIVANLPYLSEKEYQNLSPEVKKYEPKSALVGGKNGHEIICKLIDQTIASDNRFEMFLEISPTVYPQIKKHLARQNYNLKTKVKKDLSGKIRIMHIMRII